MESSQEIKDKPLMWYFHPNEFIRMMRCNIFENISLDVDLSPKYANDINIGALVYINEASIQSYDKILHYLVDVNNIKNILIYLDGQELLDDVQKLQKKYNKNTKIEVYSTEKELWKRNEIGSLGEQNAFLVGLKWAKENKYDVLVKTDSLYYKWVDEFKKLVVDSDGITFGYFNEEKKIPLNVKNLAVNVNAWNNSYVIDMLSWFIENEFVVSLNHFIDKLVKVLDYQNFSKKYEKWKQTHKTGYVHSGYVHWNYLKNEETNDILYRT